MSKTLYYGDDLDVLQERIKDQCDELPMSPRCTDGR
jgi:hypothetical protein